MSETNKPRSRLRDAVTIATVGMSTCLNGACDPVPPSPPSVECNEVKDGELITVKVTRGSGLTLHVDIDHAEPEVGQWVEDSVKISNLTGVTLVGTPEVAQEFVNVTLELTSPTVASGGFDFEGMFQGYSNSGACPVKRRFNFTNEGGDIKVAMAAPRPTLPLARRGDAVIQITGSDGHDLELAARVASGRLAWSATGGELVDRGDGRAHWRLPHESGLYQVELVVDHGEQPLGRHLDRRSHLKLPRFRARREPR